MALQYWHKGVNLDDVTDDAIDKGYYTPMNEPYTSPANLTTILQEHGATVFAGNASNDVEGQAILFAHLKTGAPIVVDVTVSTKENGGDAAHFVVVTELTVDNTIYFNDSYSLSVGASIRNASWNDFQWAWVNNNDATNGYGGRYWFAAVYP